MTGLILILFLAGCDQTGETPNLVVTPSITILPTPRLIFKAGFEGTTRLEERTSGQHMNIRGYDDLSTPSDWYKNLEADPYIGGGQFYLEQGDTTQRSIAIVADPVNQSNKVLRMRITDQHILLASGERKTRIQYELNNKLIAPAGGYMKEYYQKCRLYFSPDFSVLENSGTDDIGWFVMQEYWNDPLWDAPQTNGTLKPRRQARTGIEIYRKNGKLYFGAKGRDPEMEVPRMENNSWEVINTNFPIPLGKWMTQEIYIKEGGSAGTANPGGFYMAITLDGLKTTIVSKVGMTTSEEPGYIPDGQSSWSPMKVYTEGKVGTWFKNKNKKMDVYWDDLEIWMNKRP